MEERKTLGFNFKRDNCDSSKRHILKDNCDSSKRHILKDNYGGY